VLLGTQSTLPALIIYGLSYVLPIALLQRIDPFPVAMRLRAVSAAVIRELLRFAAPVWVSHAFFTLSAAIDVLLLERFWGEEAVGVYALTRTIVMGFTFFPQGLTMLLMPKVAGSVEGQHRRILYSSLAINVLVVAVLFGIYLLLYRPVVTFVGEAYYIGMTFAVVMALSAAVYTVHAILTSYLVGRKQPELETVSRVVNTLVTVVGGLLLIPRLGVQGAAYASLLSAVLATLAYPTLLLLRPSGVLRR
jgi:O-antigen/teichoic acid export membrane protein